LDDVANSAWRSEPPFESGGGGLASTSDDYFAFSRMMLNKGRHGREQMFFRATVELMTSDQLTPEQRAGSEILFGTHSSWALGMAVDIRRNEIFHTPNRFGWTGGFGTTAYIDPGEGTIGILFT
jgi:CubicO group peptidase (beta-lactamase class C family)